MLSEEPDLTRELDAAEEIVTGRAETVVTEWGSRDPDPAGEVFEFRHLGHASASGVVSSRNHRGMPTVLVRRTVTYGPWEEVPCDG